MPVLGLIASYFVGKSLLDIVKKVVLIPSALIVMGLVVSAIVFFFSAIVTVYNLINDFLKFAPSTDGISIKFYSFLNAIGIIDALIIVMPLIMSALVYLLVSVLFDRTLKFAMFLFYLLKSGIEK